MSWFLVLLMLAPVSACADRTPGEPAASHRPAPPDSTDDQRLLRADAQAREVDAEEGIPLHPLDQPAAPDLGPLTAWEPSLQCAPGTMPVVGSAGCAWIGAPCPEGNWPEKEFPGETLFVSPSGQGDGSSPDKPLGSLETAVSLAPAGGTIVLSKGRFETPIQVHHPLHLNGTCARDTVIAATDISPSAESGSTDAVVQFQGAHDWSLSNLRVTGKRVGVSVDAGSLRLSGLWVDGAAGVGIYASTRSGDLQMDLIDSAVTGTTTAGEQSAAVWLEGGADQLLSAGTRDVWIDESSQHALYNHGSVLSLYRTIITRAGDPGKGGAALQLEGATDLVQVLIQSSTGDAAVKCTGCQLSGSQIVIEDGDTLAGLHVSNIPGSEGQARAELEDLRISNIRPGEDSNREAAIWGPGGGHGALVTGGTLQLTRTRVELTTSVGILALTGEDSLESGGAPCSLRLSDVTVADTLPDLAGRNGVGVAALDGSSLAAFFLSVEGNTHAGIVLGAWSAVSGFEPPPDSVPAIGHMGHVWIRNTRTGRGATSRHGAGDGLVVNAGATLSLEEFAIHDNDRIGVRVTDTPGREATAVWFSNGDVAGHPLGAALHGRVHDPRGDLYRVNLADNLVPLSTRAQR